MAVKKKVSASMDSFIDKGADVKASKKLTFKNVLIRIHESILLKVDWAVENNPGITRTQWILQAIQEKIKNDV